MRRIDTFGKQSIARAQGTGDRVSLNILVSLKRQEKSVDMKAVCFRTSFHVNIDGLMGMLG